MITLQLEQAKTLAREIIASKPKGFRYNASIDGCFYVPVQDVKTNRPDKDVSRAAFNDPIKQTTGCLIGEMLKKAGVPVDILAESTQSVGVWYRSNSNSNEYSTKPLHSYITMDDRTLKFLTLMQLEQDRGSSWQDSYDYAERYIDF